MSKQRIVVGVDGSEPSRRAVEWSARHAQALGAEVVVVHVVDLPVYLGGVGAMPYVMPPLTPEQRDELRDVVARDWCKPLADAGVAHRVLLMEGRAAPAIIEAARTEQADIIVTGRRGRGGFAELVLGSTSHELTHHADRPLVIVP